MNANYQSAARAAIKAGYGTPAYPPPDFGLCAESIRTLCFLSTTRGIMANRGDATKPQLVEVRL